MLFLGMVRRGEFETLQQHGLRLGVLADTNNKQRLGDVSAFATVQRFDFSRPLPELLDAVRDIDRQFGISCLFNVVEFYVARTAEVAAALGLPSISPDSARLCLDKSVMRERFQSRIGPTSSARFQTVTAESDLAAFAEQVGYPVFLQPANVSASMWATRNNDFSSLLANYRKLCDEVPRYFERIGQKDKALSVVAAKYIEGPNTSVDCLVDHGGRVYTTPPVDVFTGQDVGIDDFHHFARIVPSRMPAVERDEVDRLAAAGCQALDMTSAAAHVEFIGTRLGEIAARPGGNRPRILQMAYGIDVLHAYYQVLRGEAPDLQPWQKRAAAIVTPFAPRDGLLREIFHLDRLAGLPGYLYHEVRAQPGQPVGLSKSGHRAPLYIEFVADDVDVVRRSVDEVASWSDLYAVE